MKRTKRTELIGDLKGGNTHHHKSQGQRTREALEKKGVISPDTSQAIQIKPGLSITPKEEFKTPLDRLKWIERMKVKFNIV